MSEIGIRKLTGAFRAKDGTMSYALMDPFLPSSLREELHHGGNSVCFAIQLAHLMGADPIYLVGFTLQNGSGYFFGRTNPVTRRPTVYQHERALAWCRWYESKFPGRVQLDPSFDGPIYSVFKKANFDARETSTGHQPPLDRGDQPVAHRVDADEGAVRPASRVNPPVARRDAPQQAKRAVQRGRVIGGRPHKPR